MADVNTSSGSVSFVLPEHPPATLSWHEAARLGVRLCHASGEARARHLADLEAAKETVRARGAISPSDENRHLSPADIAQATAEHDRKIAEVHERDEELAELLEELGLSGLADAVDALSTSERDVASLSDRVADTHLETIRELRARLDRLEAQK